MLIGRFMRNLIIFVFLSLSVNVAFSATCTTITRTNYTTNQVLTSTALNADFNNIYNRTNDLDGGCITDGTVEFSAIDASAWGAVLKGIQQGCKVSYSDSNTISIGKCLASVNGNLVETTAATTATWGCTGCASEVASTTYYAYIKTGSASATIDPLISTTAPNEDGYDNSGNKVLARFYNNATSNIDQYSIDQWRTNGFTATGMAWTSYTPTFGAGWGTPSNVSFKYRRIGGELEVMGFFTMGTVSAAVGSFSLPSDLVIDSARVTRSNTTAASGQLIGHLLSNQNIGVGGIVTATGTSTTLVYASFAYDTNPNKLIPISAVNGAWVSSTDTSIYFKVPIAGWND